MTKFLVLSFGLLILVFTGGTQAQADSRYFACDDTTAVLSTEQISEQGLSSALFHMEVAIRQVLPSRERIVRILVTECPIADEDVVARRLQTQPTAVVSGMAPSVGVPPGSYGIFLTSRYIRDMLEEERPSEMIHQVILQACLIRSGFFENPWKMNGYRRAVRLQLCQLEIAEKRGEHAMATWLKFVLSFR